MRIGIRVGDDSGCCISAGRGAGGRRGGGGGRSVAEEGALEGEQLGRVRVAGGPGRMVRVLGCLALWRLVRCRANFDV